MIDSKQDYLELCTEAELIELPDKVRMGFMKELALKRIPTALGRLRGYRLVAPRAGAWIETGAIRTGVALSEGRAPCGRVD